MSFEGAVTQTYSIEVISPPEGKGSIIAYTPPGPALRGDTVTVSATAKNIGTDSGIFQFRLRDADGDVDSTDWFPLVAGGTWTKTLTGIMPDRDWDLTLILERLISTGTAAVDDEKKFTAVNTVNWWDAIKTRWNGLTGWQKALIVTAPLGSVILGGAIIKRDYQ